LSLDPPRSTLFPYTTLFRSLVRRYRRDIAAQRQRDGGDVAQILGRLAVVDLILEAVRSREAGVRLVSKRTVGIQIQYAIGRSRPDRKSTRLNSSHQIISYAV